MYYSSSTPIRYYCQFIYTKKRSPETTLEIKKDFIFPGPLLTRLSRIFLATEKNRAVVFSHKPLSNTIKYRDGRRDLLIIWEDIFLQIRIGKSS